MGKKEGSRAEYNEEERRNFLLGFHNRKQQRKVDYLTKKLLSEKREHAMERIARRRNLLKREKELGLMKPDYAQKSTKSTEEHMKDDFSKNAFGADEVTVTVEYDGDEDVMVNDIPDEELLKDEEKKGEEEEEELNEEEEKMLEGIKLTDREIRRIHEQASQKRKKKGKKSGGNKRRRR
ncbi:hypothetical protein AV274_2095 [Blastocystis sp. ATCC 50177/Nand II]|uniref:Nucleolar protein 12 n=1 Tax=Blastocystis sp. subtype 1 (strain ATCC 50177 / NandII) TaxID=478820 RepID=A0A196SJP7_BLAHN|nr:hypothetical protein AV274_2095 [Blastocystis sp. ATCC 50177/Nand II]